MSRFFPCPLSPLPRPPNLSWLILNRDTENFEFGHVAVDNRGGFDPGRERET